VARYHQEGVMGIGDEIMATAEARYFNELYGKKVVFSLNGQVFYNEAVMKNNPRIEKEPRQGDKYVVIANGPGCRPYIAGGDSKRWYWNTDFQLEPGEIFLTPDEIESGIEAKGKILIEPYVKETNWSKNKEWPHWGKFIEMAMNLPLAQMTYDHRPALVKEIKTKTFRRALGYLYNCDMIITADGALHHAAAALGVPCITLWGGLITPDILGYDEQINLWHGAKACGSKYECPHCKEAMAAIQPEEVIGAVHEMRRRCVVT